MLKRIIKIICFYFCFFILSLVISGKWGLGLNFLDLQLSPVKFGLAWAITAFIIGMFTYISRFYILDLLKDIKHAKKLSIKDAALNNLDVALEKLEIAKNENSYLATEISKVYSMIKEFQNKLDILNQLLANHNKDISIWDWMVDFNEESEQEILLNVREVIDTSIVFDNENVTDSNLKSATEKLNTSIERIGEILQKYDEFLDVVQKILEQKLRCHGNVVTDSLDIAIQTAKKVYGIYS